MQNSAALLVVDVQYDFLPGGSLAVKEGDQILPLVCGLLNEKWEFVVASQDYHPPGHISFASTHKKDAFTQIEVPNPYASEGGSETITQMLWPDHCVQGTHGVEIEASVESALRGWMETGRGMLVQKGTYIDADAYSAFGSQPGIPPNSSLLARELRSKGITKLFAVGIATDYCVRASVLDAAKAGFEVFVIREAVRAVGGEDGTKAVVEECNSAGVKFISINDNVLKEL